MALTVPEYSRLLNILNQTKTKESDKAMYEFLKNLLGDIKRFSDAAAGLLNSQDSTINGIKSKAILTADDPLPELQFGRDLLAGTGISFDDTVDNERTVSAASSFVPYVIADGDTFTVPEFMQALFHIPIQVNGTLKVDGILVWVD